MTTDDDYCIPDNHAAQFTRELLDQAIMLAARDRAMAAANTVEVRDLAERIDVLTMEVDRAKDDAKSYHAVEKALARVRGEARPGTPADELISKIIDQREAYYGFMNEARDSVQAIVRDRDTAMTLMRLRDDSYPTCEESARALIAKFDQVTEHGRRAASDLSKAQAEVEGYRSQLGVETDRLAKLEAEARALIRDNAAKAKHLDSRLAELDARSAKHPAEPERCPVCNWTNGKLMNYGVVGEPRWMCHGCAARAIQGQRTEPLTVDRLAEALDFSGALVKEGEPRAPQILRIADAVMRYLVPSTVPSTLPSDEMRSALLEAIHIISHFPTTQLADEAVERFKAIASRPVTVAAVSGAVDVFAGVSIGALESVYGNAWRSGRTARAAISAVLDTIRAKLVAPVDPAEFAREFQGYLHQLDTSLEGWKTWAEFKPVEQREIVNATRRILEAKGIPVTPEKPATSHDPSGDAVAAAGAVVIP